MRDDEMNEEKLSVLTWSLMLSGSVITLNVHVVAEKYHIIYLSTFILSIEAVLGRKLQGYGDV